MVLTQHEIKPRYWRDSESPNDFPMHMNSEVFSTGQVLPNRCTETNDTMVVDCQQMNSFVGISNGYYGYQPVSSSTKQGQCVNDCDMSMNCDNVQEDDAGSMPTNSGSIENVCQISTYLGHNQMQMPVSVCQQRKRTSDSDQNENYCSKRARQEDVTDHIEIATAIKSSLAPERNNFHESLEDLLYGIHGSSTNHWLRNFEHD